MNVKIKMPDFGTTSSEVTVLRWLVETGQRIERGQPLMEIETDKSTMEVESIVTGVVREFLVDCNDSVESGQVIVIIEVEARVDSPSANPAAPAATPLVTASEQPKATSPKALPANPRGGSLFSRNRAQKPAERNDPETEPS